MSKVGAGQAGQRGDVVAGWFYVTEVAADLFAKRGETADFHVLQRGRGPTSHDFTICCRFLRIVLGC